MMRKIGKTALITGATGKLGSQIALHLARAGFSIVCHYNTHCDRALELVDQIRKESGQAIEVGADLADSASLEKLFELPADFPPLSLLVNSASIFERTQLSEIDSENLDRTMRINFQAPLLLSKLFVSKILQSSAGQNPRGKIINIADVAAELNWANYSPYCASKAALVSMTKTLARELAPELTVNAVSPGIVSWPEGFDDQDKLYQISKIPMKRAATAQEICSAIEFIIANDYITGQIINVDGGRSL